MNESLGGLTLAEIGQTDALVWAVAVELDMPRIGQTLPGGGCVRTIFAMRQDNPASLARAVATVVAEPLERRLLGVRHLPLRLVVSTPAAILRAVAEAAQGAGHTFGLLLLFVCEHTVRPKDDFSGGRPGTLDGTAVKLVVSLDPDHANEAVEAHLRPVGGASHHRHHHATASHRGATRTRPAQMPRCRAVMLIAPDVGVQNGPARALEPARHSSRAGDEI
jgi:hypothetical protein